MVRNYNFFDVLEKPKRICFVDPLIIATDFLEEAEKDPENFYQFIAALKFHVPYILKFLILGSKNSLVPIKIMMEPYTELLDKHDLSKIKNRDDGMQQAYNLFISTMTNKTAFPRLVKSMIGRFQSTLTASEYAFLQCVIHQSLDYGLVFERYADYIKEQSATLYNTHSELSIHNSSVLHYTNKENDLFFDGRAEQLFFIDKTMQIIFNWYGTAYNISEPDKIFEVDDRNSVGYAIMNGPFILARKYNYDYFFISQKVMNNLQRHTLSEWAGIIAKNEDTIHWVVAVRNGIVVKMEEKNIIKEKIDNLEIQPSPFSLNDSYSFCYWNNTQGKRVSGIILNNKDPKNIKGIWKPFDLVNILV